MIYFQWQWSKWIWSMICLLVVNTPWHKDFDCSWIGLIIDVNINGNFMSNRFDLLSSSGEREKSIFLSHPLVSSSFFVHANVAPLMMILFTKKLRIKFLWILLYSNAPHPIHLAVDSIRKQENPARCWLLQINYILLASEKKSDTNSLRVTSLDATLLLIKDYY